MTPRRLMARVELIDRDRCGDRASLITDMNAAINGKPSSINKLIKKLMDSI